MPYRDESQLPTPIKDAPASTETQLCFVPPNGPFDGRSAASKVTGTLSSVTDEDWILIELSAGKEYTIDLDGMGRLEDTILKLLDSKGKLITMNDNVDGARGDLSSRIVFTPESGSGTQKYYLSVSAFAGNPGYTWFGQKYTVTAKERAAGPSDITGTTKGDKLVGTDDGERIDGLAGNDRIEGKGGNDDLRGGPGADLLIGGPGADKISGGADEPAYPNPDPNAPPMAMVPGGSDTVSYISSPKGVKVNLRAGTASGGDADGDTFPEDDIENVQGSMHADVLSGNAGGNELFGLGGDDTLFGGAGNDELDGGAGDDDLDGGPGNDRLYPGPGADTLTGGGGVDILDYRHSEQGVTVRLHSRQLMGGDAEGDTWGKLVTVDYMLPDKDGKDQALKETVPDIFRIEGSHHDDVLAGDSRGNRILGKGGNDKIYGGPGGGDDFLVGGPGNDMVYGGRGTDILDGDAGDDVLVGGPGKDTTVQGGPGNDIIYADRDDISGNYSIRGDSGTDTLSFERQMPDKQGMGVTLELGTPNNQAQFAALGFEVLIGTSGIDKLTGRAAVAETIEGLDGADVLDGKGGGGGDTVSYRSSDRRVTVNLQTNKVSGGHAQGDTIKDFKHAIGSAYDDIITGTDDIPGNNLKGLAGRDELIGGIGNDTLEGGPGADRLYGGDTTPTKAETDTNNSDTLSYASSSAGVVANLATHTYSGGDAEGDEVAVVRDAYDPDGSGPLEPVDVSTFVNLAGSNHDDTLTGDHRSNVIRGSDGNDVLVGGDNPTDPNNTLSTTPTKTAPAVSFGNTVNDHLQGDKGDDTLMGGPGVDFIWGGPGADLIDGGESKQPGAMYEDIDIALYGDAKTGITVDLSTNTGTAGDAKGDRLVDIEFIWGSPFDDTFIATADSDRVNIIQGNGGSDTVSYQAHDAGVDVDLVAHNETVAKSGNVQFPRYGTAPVTDVELKGNTQEKFRNPDNSAGADNPALGDRLASIENLTGTEYADRLFGDAQNNVLKGMGGNDNIDGLTGDDTLEGGAGNDLIRGGDGHDRIIGGPGDDDLYGDGPGFNSATRDTFVFAPGHGNDIIGDLVRVNSARTWDYIDLRAFNLEAEDLIKMIYLRGTGGSERVIIDLQSVGGGTIEISNSNFIEDFELTSDPTNGEIDNLSVLKDVNGNGQYDANVAGEVDGLFIL